MSETGVPISALPTANTVAGEDFVVVVQGPVEFRVTRKTTAGVITGGATGFAVPVAITTTPGDSRTLTDADRGYTLVWDGDVPLPVIVPPDLPAGFQVALMQSGVGHVVVQEGAGVVVLNRLDHNGTAGIGSVIVLLQGTDVNEYTLGGDTGFGLSTEAPVIEPQTITIDDSAPIGTYVTTFTAQRQAGIVAWSITGGNTGGAFAIGVSTGIVTTAAVLDAGTLDQYSIDVLATNAFGQDTAVLTANIIEASYNPILAGADAWFQPRRLETRQIIDVGEGTNAYAYILDATQRGPQLYASSDPYQFPRPTIVTPGGDFNGLETASFTSVSTRLVGNAAAIDGLENVTGIGVEMVIEASSLSALQNVLTQRILGIITLFAIDINGDGQIVVTTRRVQTDSVRTVTTTIGVRLQDRNYLYVGINYSTGLITIQINDVVQTFAGTWTNGTGSTPAAMTGAMTLGALGGITTWRMAELAIYGGVLLSLETRTLHRSQLMPVYDLAGTSVPGVPTEAPVLTGQDYAIDDGYLAGRFVAQIIVDNAVAAGATLYSIIGGNTGGAFALDEETGYLTTAINPDHETNPSYTLEIEAENSLGSDAAFFGITVGPGNYNPGAYNAWYWGQFSNDATRTIVDQGGDQSVSLLTDILNSTSELYGGGGSFLNPVLIQQWNSLDVATFGSVNQLLAGNERIRDITTSANLSAVEMAVAIVGTAATHDVVRWSTNSTATSRFKIDTLNGGQIRVITARLDTDTTRTFTTTMTVTAGAKNYLFVSVDWTNGEIVVQLNGTTETTTVVWDGGYGPSSASRSAGYRLGYYNAVPSMQVAEIAMYRDDAPGPEGRAINRTSLQETYGLV